LEKETGGKTIVGTYGLFAHPMSMITAVGKHLLGKETGGKMLLGHLQAFSPQILMIICLNSVVT